jgi:hypothetical protein
MNRPANLRALWRVVGFRVLALMTLGYAVGTVRAWLRSVLHWMTRRPDTAPEGGE